MTSRERLSLVYGELTPPERVILLLRAIVDRERPDPRVLMFMPDEQQARVAELFTRAKAMLLMVPVAEIFLAQCRLVATTSLLHQDEAVPILRARQQELATWVRWLGEVVDEFDDEIVVPPRIFGIMAEVHALLIEVRRWVPTTPRKNLLGGIDRDYLTYLHELLEGYEQLVG